MRCSMSTVASLASLLIGLVAAAPAVDGKVLEARSELENVLNIRQNICGSDGDCSRNFKCTGGGWEYQVALCKGGSCVCKFISNTQCSQYCKSISPLNKGGYLSGDSCRCQH